MSLLVTVKAAHATTSQLNTLDHADTPGDAPAQVAVNVLPALDV